MELALTYVHHLSSLSVLPAEVEEGVAARLHVHQTFPLVGCDDSLTQAHLPGSELHQAARLSPLVSSPAEQRHILLRLPLLLLSTRHTTALDSGEVEGHPRILIIHAHA